MIAALPRIDWGQGDIRIRTARLEPIATTVAILLGLAVTQAADFSNATGGTTGLGWAAFALTLFLTLGGCLAPRPRRAKPPRRRGWEAMGDEFEARVEEVVEEFRQGFSRRT